MTGATPDIDKLNTSGITLPAYVLLRLSGVYINLSPPPAQDILRLFVDRLFSSEARFDGLDYACFLHLLYDEDPVASFGGASEIRIANSIVRFPPQRMDLYKGVKVSSNGDRAAYMFEPTFIDVIKDEPVYGEPDGDGVIHIVSYKQSIETLPTQLNFDEFVASMWTKGVRFGIDAESVRNVIKKGLPTRMDIAFQREPTDSKDAEVVEESDTLRQDNAPLILSNGKADLRRARNRFPQVSKNAPLLRKIPRQLGKPGFTVTGTMVEARIPEDIDLDKLAGEGTRIDRISGNELLVANMDGFLVLDEVTGEIWVTAKIENKGGISAKSTGDIRLTVDEFTEHGEVQEGRIVEGKHMTFHSDVFGTILAQAGHIVLDKNLSGGIARSVGGNITVNGRIINATVDAWDGNIEAEFAEGSIIMGKRVSIGRAVNCEIVAEEVELGISEGCSIAAKRVQIATSSARKHRETIIAILLPDIAGYDRQIAEAVQSLLKIEQALQAKNREIAATQSDPGFAKYIALSEKVRAGTITFTPEQQAGWQKIVNQYAPILRASEVLMKKFSVLDDAIKRWKQERKTCSKYESCKIETIQGETLVRKISSNHGLSVYRDLPQQELKSKLQEMGAAPDQLFSGHSGSLDWHFKVPVNPT